MSKEKIKRFLSGHKFEIVSVGAIVLGVTLCAVGIKTKPSLKKVVDNIPDLANNVDIPTEFAVGKITELWKEGEWLNAIVNDVTVKDLGHLGDEFVKHGIVPDKTKVTMLIGFI